MFLSLSTSIEKDVGAQKAGSVLNLRQLKVNIKQAVLKPFVCFITSLQSQDLYLRWESRISHMIPTLKGLKPSCWIQMTDLLFPGAMARGVGHSANSNS